MSSGHIAVITARRADENRGRCVGRPPPAPGAAPDRAGLMNLPVDLRGRNPMVLPYFWVSVYLPARFRCGTTIWSPSDKLPSDECWAPWSQCPCVWSDVCRRRVTVECLLRKYISRLDVGLLAHWSKPTVCSETNRAASQVAFCS